MTCPITLVTELDGVGMSIEVRRFLKARRDRALGSILGYLEAELKGKVAPEKWVEIRTVILDAINGYHDSVLDLMKSDDGTSVRNEEVVDLLERVETALQDRRRPTPAQV